MGILEYVLENLERSRGRWPRIADATGVPYHTLTKIAQRQIEDPGVKHIQVLHDYFREQQRLESVCAPNPQPEEAA